MKRLAQAVFCVFLAAVALGLPGEAQVQAYKWSLVVVDGGHVGYSTSIALGAKGDPVISYYEGWPDDYLKFAICDLSGSARRNCDEADDWSLATVDSTTPVAGDTRIALDADGDPMMSYAMQDGDLMFAVCDLSASARRNCDQTADWSTVTVDAEGVVGYYNGIAMDANGDPMISYWDGNPNYDLKFAICDLSGSTNGNCDQSDDWSTVAVDSGGYVGEYTSIAVGADGDPVISYLAAASDALKFAICDLSASTNGSCDQPGDWRKTTVDAGISAYQLFTSIVVDTNGDPMISYFADINGDLKFAICDLSASTNANCDQPGDWSTVILDSGGVGLCTSIAVNANGDPMISYHDWANHDLKFASCEMSASTNGNCDQPGDWSTETVDSEGNVGEWTSVAVDTNGDPVISYFGNFPQYYDLKFATALPPRGPVGGIAELPDVSDSSARNYMAVAGGLAAVMALAAGGWYARRRWVR